MLGVIVWSKESAQAAVVWCEDHGDIAYLSGYDGLAAQPDCLSPDPAPPPWPAVGDLVTLDTAHNGTQRLARNLVILRADWGPALPDSLLDMAQGLSGSSPGADPAARPAWQRPTPAFPPAPFAPVPAGQGIMSPVAHTTTQTATPAASAPVLVERQPARVRCSGGLG